MSVTVGPGVAPATSLLAGVATPAIDASALVVGSEVVSHRALTEAVADLAAQLPSSATGRRLIHLPMRPTLGSVIGYLATLEAGHVALVTAPEGYDRIVRHYPADLRLIDGALKALSTGNPDDRPAHLLHPDLAVLLSTSGSTGSPKLVRLSHDNLRRNADAIANALSLTAADRAITSLPLHYCFGLSVLHSHLRAGASVALHGGSVQDASFWRTIDEQRVTTLAVVPHSAELVLDSGHLDQPHPSLRLIAQAGGRLHPDRVRALAALGQEHAIDLAVMYGQTEATARIAVLPPALAATAPDAVGYPVEATTVRLDTDIPESTDPGVGELVVTGPGVMLGYAEHPDDLALGRMQTELRTGDLARLDADGLVRIVGRRSGFLKVMGLRIDLAQIEEDLRAAGFEACVTGDDSGLRVAVAPARSTSSAHPDDPDAAEAPDHPEQPYLPDHRRAAYARAVAAASSSLGPAAVQAAVVPLARLESGKVDRLGCDALVRAAIPAECDGARQRVGDSARDVTDVIAVLTDVLAVDALDPTRSFAQQGGDSLSHVQASTRLTALLGTLPRDWHHRPLRDLVTPTGSTAPMGRTRRVETSVVLRAVAAMVILGTHADLFWIVGGAHILLVVAGFNAARFGLSAAAIGTRLRATARTMVGILVPAAVVAGIGLATTGRYGWANVGGINWIAGDVTYGARNELWFIDALLASVLIMTATLSVPAISRAYARDPWRVSAVVAALALVPRFVILAIADGTIRGIAPTVFWLFAIGAMIAHADSRRRTQVTLALAAIGVVTFFDDPVRNATILAGIVVLALVPDVRLPRRAVPIVATIASASLFLYLVQFQVFDVLPDLGARLPSAALRVVAATAVGVLVWRVADPAVRRLQQLIPLAPPRKDS